MARLLLLTFCFVLGLEGRAEDNSVFGTYRGVLRHHSLRKDQRASLDLLFERAAPSNELEITAILTLSFGERSQGEYVSYVFEKVRYNPILGTLAFDQADQGLTIVVSQFSNGRIEGKVRAPLLGSSPVTLILDRNRAVPQQFPLLREMSGTYRSENGVLELQAFRSPTEKQDGGSSPFGENEIRGHLARSSAELGGLVVDSVFTESAYDFFKGKLELFGNLEPLSCDVEEERLICEGETFNREPDGQLAPAAPAAPLWKTEVAPGTAPTGPVSGQYWGYVHNEERNQYHVAGLNLVALPPTGTEGFEISALASLHFGDREGIEAIAYKYEPKSYPLLTKQFLLKEKSSEAIIQVTSWEEGVLRGVWYSRCYGRVGTFELQREKLRALPANARTLQPLRGTRKSNLWQVQLRVAPRPVAIHSANPFSPLGFGGILYDLPRVVIPKSRISGGSYDFYTGRLFLPVEVSGENLFLIGEHRLDGTLDLRLNLSNRFGAIYSPQRLEFSKAKKEQP